MTSGRQVGEQAVERLGRRVAAHRHKLGYTQQQLAERLAISRVAVSHLEAGLTVPSERTVALLAGLFKVDPVDFVAGSDYPLARAERLPSVVARYTEAEHMCATIEALIEALLPCEPAVARAALAPWRTRAHAALPLTRDSSERALLRDALAAIDRASF